MDGDNRGSSNQPLPGLLESWREAERATERPKTAALAARKAADAAAATAEAVSETARNADATLQAAERARDVAASGAREALALSGIAGAEMTNADDDVVGAEAATARARDAYHEADRSKGETL